VIIDHLHGSTPSSIETDICVIGAGAAGIAIAHAFVGTSTRVCLVESGGLAGERKSQQLYEGDSIGALPLDPGTSRMRAFGGSCNLWGGGCMPLNSEDLRQRDWVPHSDWPISYEDIEPFYAGARSFCQIEPHDIVDGAFLTPPGRAPIPFDENHLANRTFARSPIVFGDAYRATLERAPNITVLLHANLLELRSRACGTSVEHARIGSLNGRESIVRARHYVLASGGMENARLLLLSNAHHPAGLGNDHDQVGRYFMDHPSGRLGTLHSRSSGTVTRPYDRRLGKGRVPVFPEICLSDAAQRNHAILGGRVHPFAMEGHVPNGIRAVRELRAALRTPTRDEGTLLAEQLCEAMRNPALSSHGGAAAMPEGIARLALRVAPGMWDIAKAFSRRMTDRPTVPSDRVELIGYFEQAPNPLSRITLGNDLDALGQRKACVDWQLTALDRHTYRVAATLSGDELAKACNGRFEPEPWLLEENARPPVHGTAHHMGTTRMSDDPRRGVVDRHCRVHGIDNLHVAGSSVFSTSGGWAFPTLTIVALSQRLAQTLKSLPQ
jgi:choline dehydrogenase-like flavoprotein